MCKFSLSFYYTDYFKPYLTTHIRVGKLFYGIKINTFSYIHEYINSGLFNITIMYCTFTAVKLIQICRAKNFAF